MCQSISSGHIDKLLGGTYWRKRLHNVTVVDVASVRQDGSAGKARECLPLRSQKHDVACRHLGEVCQATSNALVKKGQHRINTTQQDQQTSLVQAFGPSTYIIISLPSKLSFSRARNAICSRKLLRERINLKVHKGNSLS